MSKDVEGEHEYEHLGGGESAGHIGSGGENIVSQGHSGKQFGNIGSHHLGSFEGSGPSHHFGSSGSNGRYENMGFTGQHDSELDNYHGSQGGHRELSEFDNGQVSSGRKEHYEIGDLTSQLDSEPDKYHGSQREHSEPSDSGLGSSGSDHSSFKSLGSSVISVGHFDFDGYHNEWKGFK